MKCEQGSLVNENRNRNHDNSQRLQLVCIRGWNLSSLLWNGMVCLIEVFMSLDNFALYTFPNP